MLTRSKLAVLAAFGVLTLGVPAPVALGQAAAENAPGRFRADMTLPSAERRMKETATRIADHVYMIRAPLGFGPVPLANEILIEQADGLVLVDAGKTRGAGLRIVTLIRGISTKPVKAVILTHWHPDHVLGLGPILEAWPKAAIVANEATRDAICGDESYRGTPRVKDSTRSRDSSRAAVLRRYAEEYGPRLRDPALSPEERAGWAEVVGVLNLRIADERGTYLVPPNVTFRDDYRIDDRMAPVRAISVGPAHTDGDVIVWMPRQRIVAAGDIVVAPIPYGGDHIVEWPATLATLRRLSPRLVVPGHGPLETMEYVNRVIDAFMELQFKSQPLIAGPALNDDEVLARIDLRDARQRFAGRDPWLSYWFDQYFAPSAIIAYRQLRKLESQ
jgi:glyoxylase-like metal-dependent hydrolase (beta-lactamase superfamily II)